MKTITLMLLAALIVGCGPGHSPLASISGSGNSIDKDSGADPSDSGTAAPSAPDDQAEPPPITLGSYPWIVITKAEKVPGTSRVRVYGIVLDEDDPPGIYIRSGHMFVESNQKKTATFPLTIISKADGLISWEMDNLVMKHARELDAVMTGPGYTNVKFPVCDYEDFAFDDNGADE